MFRLTAQERYALALLSALFLLGIVGLWIL